MAVTGSRLALKRPVGTTAWRTSGHCEMFAELVADLRSRQVTPLQLNGNEMFALLFKQESHALA